MPVDIRGRICRSRSPVDAGVQTLSLAAVTAGFTPNARPTGPTLTITR
jgi:hypothetical protein